MIVAKCSPSEVGRCNFCNNSVELQPRVYMMRREGGGLEARICDNCYEELKKEVENNGR